MMKRNVRLFAVLLIILLSFSSCVRQASPPPVDPEESSAPVTTAVPEQTAPPETETDPPETTESPPETEESETKEATEEATLPDDIVWTPVTEVYEEVIFGNETLPADTPSTEGPQQQTVYDPTYPSGGGTAPLGLMYHLILDEPYSALESLFVRPSELRGHIEALIDAGYTFIFADEYDYYDGKTVIMSFDDGYIDNYTEMFPIIKEYNVKVTVFMITNYINCPEYLTE
ncbi:MAG: polysaccharide deacetylase family protein, partial [Clostridia bacterium]|nr:polysaccharide deacetylase family protein [Clostridia bacterium]